MEYFLPFFLFIQTLGASIGAGTALWSEMAYARAMRDGKIDSAERAHLALIEKGLRFGMTLLLLSSFGLVVLSYTLQATLQPALLAEYWTMVALALLIIFVSRALLRKSISFRLGSATLFTAWWFLLYLTIGWLPHLSFGASVAFFIVATGLFYFLLQYARLLVLDKKPK